MRKPHLVKSIMLLPREHFTHKIQEHINKQTGNKEFIVFTTRLEREIGYVEQKTFETSVS